MKEPLLFALSLFGWIFCIKDANATTIVRSQTIAPTVGLSLLDANNDSIPDLDFSIIQPDFLSGEADFLISVQPLGQTGIYSENDIAFSLSEGDVVTLSSLNFVNSSNDIIVGGVIFDAFGNPVFNGFGGCSFDLLFSLNCSADAPLNVIDLFLVEIESGVAIVNIDTSMFVFGNLTINSVFFENPPNSFVLVSVPEPSAIGLIVLSIGSLLMLRRR